VKLTLRLIIAGAGLVLFAWFVHRTGVNTISRAFTTLGWSAPLILLPYALVYLLDTVGWRLCFGRTLSKAISFGTLFRIRWAGESLNNVSSINAASRLSRGHQAWLSERQRKFWLK